jgi:hypothetical protein
MTTDQLVIVLFVIAFLGLMFNTKPRKRVNYQRLPSYYKPNPNPHAMPPEKKSRFRRLLS